MPQNLLIVEDEFVIAQDMRMIVNSLGYGVSGIAKSAAEALDILDREKPDLVLLDIKIIGQVNGVELAKLIEKEYHIPYLYVTSYADTSTLNSVKETNPVGYVLKPFDKRDIRVALEMSFAKIAAMDIKPVEAEVKPKAKNSSEILGTSKVMKDALNKVAQVAPTNVTVLIYGETGTGKELFARALHNLSPRNNKPMIKVNCAALPQELIESVLFGHEKGSFTGATQKSIGKFEQADGGTIFLDEIGELPLALQPKLLRTLQEKEIDPIGSLGTKKVNVRILAATNRNLVKEVQKGNFRADLFFRLNIFPVKVPPLRERKGDVMELANKFLDKFSKSIGKQITKISDRTKKEFESYEWPGNVRELEHLIERGVIMAEGNEFEISVNSQPLAEDSEQSTFELKSLEDMEREQILQTLEYCKGKIRGVGGAAEILKINPNTLDARMKKLGISKVKTFN